MQSEGMTRGNPEQTPGFARGGNIFRGTRGGSSGGGVHQKMRINGQGPRQRNGYFQGNNQEDQEMADTETPRGPARGNFVGHRGRFAPRGTMNPRGNMRDGAPAASQ